MKCKYRIRYFSSKGAYLVLLWTLLVYSMVYASYILVHDDIPPGLRNELLVSILLVVVALVAAPLSGWLADAKFGNYKVFRFGAVLLFIFTVINCFLLILEEIIWKSNHVINWIQFCLASSFYVVGASACIATALPLGLDQMPDASASNITSYIAWFVGTFFIGLFFVEGMNILVINCVDKTIKLSYYVIWSLVLVACMSVVLSSNFLLSPKWLIIEPKSPQSLKIIFQVLKFAAKHKAPLNRSAFTYWEEDIPSRMDLGKMKYGGPFTTEQVEDVKTILRLLAITPPLFSLSFSLFFSFYTASQNVIMNSNSLIFRFLLKGAAAYSFLGTLVNEFLIYPFVRNKLPSILRRIGVASFITTLVSFVCFVLKLTHFLSNSSETTTEWIIYCVCHLTFVLVSQVLLTSVLEFMCAQSPYNMRGLLLSLVAPLAIISSSIGTAFDNFLNNKINSICTNSWCPLILVSVKVVICMLGFFLFCVVARWYKRRVRDEDYSTQRVVEEVYDRYLTAAAAQSRSYGTIN